jgi:hypothetical protein
MSVFLPDVAMRDPLEPPPLPDRGDEHRDAIHLGVGRIMTAWETIEFELSRVYSVFAGDPDGDAMRRYGEPTISRLRLDGLAETAAPYFVKADSFPKARITLRSWPDVSRKEQLIDRAVGLNRRSRSCGATAPAADGAGR